ncbi:MerR family transcriptional regulator [Bacillus sp. V2I10]|uniref:MerR family transcriptional regulator n=1 Tax=Bacillus sp. V2I10 TaxID=3042276 RepID=UPI002782AE5E|nr:MerR family transcriptional regulator [Bacillus sp. V2I10]MDQ0862394.1 DNA-binding transcriptional MerR regulator [Bacillus sp. V2I10]
MSEDIGYFSKYVCEQLGVTAPTLRRWSQTMESCGHVFEKNGQNQRIYYEKEMKLLRDLKKLVDRGQPVEAAAKYLIEGGENKREQAASDQADNERTKDDQVQSSDIEKKLDTVLERLEQQERFNRELVLKLDAQQKYIDDSLKKRDQQLVTALRELQEAKKLAAPTKEEEEPSKENKDEKPKGWFSRLFG